MEHETQLKASRDVRSSLLIVNWAFMIALFVDSSFLCKLQVAMATAAKAKLLLRELKTMKADLAFAKERCAQLEQENKHLRENHREKGSNPADEDLVKNSVTSCPKKLYVAFHLTTPCGCCCIRFGSSWRAYWQRKHGWLMKTRCTQGRTGS